MDKRPEHGSDRPCEEAGTGCRRPARHRPARHHSARHRSPHSSPACYAFVSPQKRNRPHGTHESITDGCHERRNGQ